MNSELGQFSDGFALFRRSMAAVSPIARLPIFMNAANEVAGYVTRGLDRVVAADELADIAVASGLPIQNSLTAPASRGSDCWNGPCMRRLRRLASSRETIKTWPGPASRMRAADR